MNYLNFSLWCSLLLLVAMACQQEEKGTDISEYYYPIADLQSGMVYEYHPVDTSRFPVEYWYFYSLDTDTARFLAGNYIDHEFNVRQFVLEEMVRNGAMLQKMTLVQVDSQGQSQQVPVEILSPAAYPFEVTDSLGVFLTKLQWNDRDVPGRTTTLIRNRRYYGKKPCPCYKPEDSCVQFRLRELISTEEVGVQELEYEGVEHYAKGVGLVHYRKEIAEDLIMEYQLAHRYTMKEFEAIFGQILQAKQ